MTDGDRPVVGGASDLRDGPLKPWSTGRDGSLKSRVPKTSSKTSTQITDVVREQKTLNFENVPTSPIVRLLI